MLSDRYDTCDMIIDDDERATMLATLTAIRNADAPRIAAIRLLPTWRLRVLYLYNDVPSSEVIGIIGASGWALGITQPDRFFVGLPTYQALVQESSILFLATCWWLVALMKIGALLSGNLYLRRIAYGLGLVAWMANACVLYADGHGWNVLVSLSLAMFAGAFLNYVHTGVELSARLDADPEIVRDAATSMIDDDDQDATVP